MWQKLDHVTFISNENTKKPKFMKSVPLNQPNVDPIVKLKMHRVYNLVFTALNRSLISQSILNFYRLRLRHYALMS